jgi:hypothetical protein
MGKPDKGHALSSAGERIARWRRTGGSEPSQYPQEEKAIAIPSVAASERGTAQTEKVSSPQALPFRGCGTLLGSIAVEPESYKPPVQSKESGKNRHRG